jgi:undecaprenyl-diphosphatase
MGSPSVRRDPWLWVGIAAAIAFVVLGLLLVRQGPFAFDDRLATAVISLPIPAAFWEACTFLGGAILVAVGVAFCLIVLASGRVRLTAICAVALVAAALFTDLAKDLVARPRPIEELEATLGFSFPSGHTLNSTTTYGLIALVAWRSRLPLAVRRSAVAIGITVPLLVGLSRIALGVHFPTDVLAGWLAGTAFVAGAAVAISVTGAMARDRPRP